MAVWKGLLIAFVILIIILFVAWLIYYLYKRHKKPSSTPAVCPPFANIPNINIPGFAITNPKQPTTGVTESACKSACTTSNCDWYNYDSVGQNCTLSQATPAANYITGFPVPTASAPKGCSPYTRLSGKSTPAFDITGNPIKGQTEAQCQQACAANSACNWYNYDSSTSNCYLKQGNSVTGTDTGFVVTVLPSGS